MAAAFEHLAWEDQIQLTLRALYESYGFRQYRMGKFEPYDMYYEHRSFLKSEGVITFTDAAGRLMALKPDVTMSIVKSTQPDETTRKLYYVENVFRRTPGSLEYGEISQIGIESIGGDDLYRETEILLLALRTLESISPDYLLAVSHMGFLSAIFDRCGFDENRREAALEALTHRNLHELLQTAASAGTDEAGRALLQAAAATSDGIPEALARFRALELNEEMKAALCEIERVFQALESVDCASRLRMDLTVANNLDYYNGVVFRGYIKDLPRSVLAGGRYDNLMRRFGKPQSALGFALYLGELARAFTEPRDYDADCLVLYGDNPPERVLQAIGGLLEKGICVRAERERSGSVRARQVCRIGENGELEVCSND